MPAFSTLEDTLFVPILGRIYTSKSFPHILYDTKALELEKVAPKYKVKRYINTIYVIRQRCSFCQYGAIY